MSGAPGTEGGEQGARNPDEIEKAVMISRHPLGALP